MSQYREIKNAQAIRSPKGDEVFVTIEFENGEIEVCKLGGKRATRASTAIIELFKDTAYFKVCLRADAQAAAKYAARRTNGYTVYGNFYANPTVVVDVF